MSNIVMGNVLFLGRPVYDYLEATLVGGLKDLGYVVHGLTLSNYIEVEVSVEHIDPIYSYIFTNRHSIDLLIKNPHWTGSAITIFVDGSDDPLLNPKGIIRSSFYLKREFLKFPLSPENIKPISFGIEDRYFSNSSQNKANWDERPVDIFCVLSARTNPARPRIVSRVVGIAQQMNLSIVTESTGERAYDNFSKGPLPTPNYYRILSGAKVGFSLFGAGQDCARFWEILGSGALLISEKITLERRLLPRHGFEALYFENTSELEQLIKWVFENPDQAREIAFSGYKWGLTYGRPRSIVSRLLTELTPRPRPLCNRLVAACMLFWVWAYNLRAKLYLKWYRSLRPKRY